MKKYIFFLLIISLWSCKENTTKIDVSQQENSTERKIVGTAINLPSIPTELMKNLYQNCSYTDYILHDLDFSISQDNKNSIKASIGFISKTIQEIKPNGCKAIGRKFFHVDGEIVLEADVFFSDVCTYYLFHVDGKPAYANKMTKEGLKFYGNIIRQGQAQRDKIVKEGTKGH